MTSMFVTDSTLAIETRELIVALRVSDMREWFLALVTVINILL
jgi:hypothetical protein